MQNLPTTLVLASHNKGKIKNLQELLMPFGITLKSALDLELPEVVEDRDTFTGNATKKALSAVEATGLPALADDSGLCVDALGGGPGVFTARYGDYNRLLDELVETPEGYRDAHFICVLALALPGQKEVKTFKGRISGRIHTEASGTGGFGYDPVFIPTGHDKTFAQLPASVKNTISHRARALKALLKYLASLQS